MWTVLVIALTVLVIALVFTLQSCVCTYNDVETFDNAKQPCTIKFLKDDKTETAVTIGDPWYLDLNNSKRCFAPAGQKCCDQTNLPSGEEGCFVDFTGSDEIKILNWKNVCTTTRGPLDVDKLGILSKQFSGDWLVESKDNTPSKDDIQFTLSISGNNLTLKRDNALYGVYNIVQISVNPKKQIQARTVSETGTKTDITVEDDKSGMIMRIIDTLANSNTPRLTTYNLIKI